MKIAVTYENGQIFQHFGHTEQFKIYEVSGSEITASEIVNTDGNGHGALAGFLKGHKVEALICGGIGGGARQALEEADIKLYGGVTGEADKAVADFLAGGLSYNPEIQCSHHHHGEEEHGCGEGHCH